MSASDFEGLGRPGLHPYMVGESEARSILDLVAAAPALDGVELSRQVGLWGFSQGGHAVLFAAELASMLAPDLDVLGGAAVAPAMDLQEWAGAALGTAEQGYIAAIIVAFANAYCLDLSTIMTERGLGYMDEITTSCTDPTGRPVAFEDDLFVSNPGTTEPWAGLLRDNSPGSVRIDAPVLLAPGTEDRLFRASFAGEALAILCAPGTNVIPSIYEGADHTGVAFAATPEILDFIDDRLAGAPVSAGCG